jgi:hypothetical protein
VAGTRRATENCRACSKTGKRVGDKWNWRQAQPQPVDEQHETLNQHQPTEPRNDGTVLQRTECEQQKQRAHQREQARCHAKPVVEHRVVADVPSSKFLKHRLSRWPAREYAKERNTPGKRGENKRQSQEAELHGCCRVCLTRSRFAASTTRP